MQTGGQNGLLLYVKNSHIVQAPLNSPYGTRTAVPILARTLTRVWYGASGVVSSDAVVPSAGGGSAGGGDGAAATPVADGRVVPQLGGLEATTLRSSNGTPAIVTIVPQTSGKGAERSWVWQVFREFAPVITEKNVFCRACRHLLKVESASRRARHV